MQSMKQILSKRYEESYQ